MIFTAKDMAGTENVTIASRCYGIAAGMIMTMTRGMDMAADTHMVIISIMDMVIMMMIDYKHFRCRPAAPCIIVAPSIETLTHLSSCKPTAHPSLSFSDNLPSKISRTF
jgi:hypothetical protein